MSKNPLPMRSALDALRLDFPQYEIQAHNVWDKLFYIAEAREGGVQPVFVQAESADRLRVKLRSPIRPFRSAGEPSIPRVYDYLLGGKNNFAADREQAKKLLKVFPHAGQLARESRQFQRRAVRYVASRGVAQFIDLGCGLPTNPNTHETAQEVQPDARTVYVDNDELVLSHAQNILAKSKDVPAVAGDLEYPDEILYDWRVRKFIDFFQPICVVSTMTLHFYEAQTARKIMDQVIDRIPYGTMSSFRSANWKGILERNSPESTTLRRSTITAKTRWRASWRALSLWPRRHRGVQVACARSQPGRLPARSHLGGRWPKVNHHL